jgi:AcrR family transcriptional regulator
MGDRPPILIKEIIVARHKKDERTQAISETRQQLLTAAADEFAQEGYSGANINRISQSAGYAKGTIYNYFPSKRALMDALIDEFSKKHLDYLVTQVRQVEGPLARLERFFEAGFAFVTQNLSPGRVIINTLYGPDAEFKAHLGRVYTPMFHFIGQEIVLPGIQQGVFRQVEPFPTAGFLMTIYLGFASTAGDDGSLTMSVKQVFDYALNGLRDTTS